MRALRFVRDIVSWVVRLRGLRPAGIFVLCMLSLAGSALGQSHERPQTDQAVEVKDGLVSLSVSDAEVAAVIREIGLQTGFRTRVRSALDQRVSLFLRDVPVNEAVRRLASSTNFVILFDYDEHSGKATKIREVRLYPATAPRPQSAVSVTDKHGDPFPLSDLAEGDVQSRIRAVHDLARVADDSAIAVLARVLREDDDPMVRGQAAAALGRIGGDSIIVALQMALGDTDQLVRVQAARGLGQSGGDTSAEILGALLLNDNDPRVRRMAAWSLGRLGGDLAFSYLDAATEDADPATRKTVLQSLGKWDEASQDDP